MNNHLIAKPSLTQFEHEEIVNLSKCHNKKRAEEILKVIKAPQNYGQ